MDDLKELLLGPDDATVRGPRFGRYPGFAGELLHEALQLPHRELHVVEESVIGYAWQGILQLLGPVSNVALVSVLYARVIVGPRPPLGRDPRTDARARGPGGHYRPTLAREDHARGHPGLGAGRLRAERPLRVRRGSGGVLRDSPRMAPAHLRRPI